MLEEVSSRIIYGSRRKPVRSPIGDFLLNPQKKSLISHVRKRHTGRRVVQWWPRPSRRARSRDRSTRTYGGVHWSGSRSKCNNCTYGERHRTSSRGVRGASTSRGVRRASCGCGRSTRASGGVRRPSSAVSTVPAPAVCCIAPGPKVHTALAPIVVRSAPAPADFAGVARVVESFTLAPAVIAARPALAMFTDTSLAASCIASALAVYGRSTSLSAHVAPSQSERWRTSTAHDQRPRSWLQPTFEGGVKRPVTSAHVRRARLRQVVCMIEASDQAPQTLKREHGTEGTSPQIRETTLESGGTSVIPLVGQRLTKRSF